MLQVVLSGLVMGCIYALVALGFVLILNASGAINFAQGDLVMVCGFIIVWGLGLPLPLVLRVVVILACVLAVGYMFQLVAYKPLQRKPFVTVFISTLGLGIAMQNLVQIIFSPDPRSLPPLFPGAVHFAGVTLGAQYIFAAATSVALLVALHVFLNRTQLGVMMRATAQDAEMARLVGVSADAVVALTFMLSTLLAAAAAFLLAPIFFLTPTMGNSLILRAFTAVVIGGFGSIPGAIVGGLSIGLIEYLSAGYVSSTWRDALTFSILMTFLVIRPQGIFGEATAEKV
jgi:branched-chain amino acid transport system permease protein